MEMRLVHETKNTLQMTNEERLESLKKNMERVNKVSPTMCLAKWLQSTVLLQNGYTHSCHHPPVHKINKEDLKKDPSALHNTQFKKEKRQELLEGKQSEDCQYCWNIENLGKDYLSDRTYKSASPWAINHIDNVMKDPLKNVNPTYLEVSFENTCNFACMYCGPDISSSWQKESKQHGPYKLSYNHHDLDWMKRVGKLPIPNREENPYIEAFWEWWPELYQDLKIFRVTGGEPLLSKNYWKVVEKIKENPRKDFEFAMNTNLQPPNKDLITKLINDVNLLNGKIHRFDIFTSAEAYGKQSEYIRYGMNWEIFSKNCEDVISNLPNPEHYTGTNFANLNFMIAFNALSITTFKQFMEQIFEWRKKYNRSGARNLIPTMTNYIRFPKFQDVRILPNEIKQKYFDDLISWAEARAPDSNFHPTAKIYLEELDQFKRLRDFGMQSLSEEYLRVQRQDFVAFYKEYDRRKNTSCLETFPELTEFWRYCENIK